MKAMRVRDLLRMATGNQTEAPLLTQNAPWTKTFLAHPVPFKPGTHFLYNSPATYMLSAIVQKVTRMMVLDYLKPRLFEPLGIENPSWVASPQGISAGAYGLSLRTEDIARFGQLYLQKGKWKGKQLIPSQWVEEAPPDRPRMVPRQIVIGIRDTVINSGAPAITLTGATELSVSIAWLFQSSMPSWLSPAGFAICKA
jgi:CubicO group peptidase (beta-lactamase class C family)